MCLSEQKCSFLWWKLFPCAGVSKNVLFHDKNVLFHVLEWAKYSIPCAGVSKMFYSMLKCSIPYAGVRKHNSFTVLEWAKMSSITKCGIPCAGFCKDVTYYLWKSYNCTDPATQTYEIEIHQDLLDTVDLLGLRNYILSARTSVFMQRQISGSLLFTYGVRNLFFHWNTVWLLYSYFLNILSYLQIIMILPALTPS